MTQTGNTTVLDNPCLELNYQGYVLNLALIKREHKFGRDPSFADLVVPRDWQVVGRCQGILVREGDNYRIYDSDGNQPSTRTSQHCRVEASRGSRGSRGGRGRKEFLPCTVHPSKLI